MYSENSKIVICLDSFSKQIYNILVLFSTYYVTPIQGWEILFSPGVCLSVRLSVCMSVTNRFHSLT